MEEGTKGESCTQECAYILFLCYLLTMLPFSQCKTGIYYLRTRPAVNAIQYTVDRNMAEAEENPTSLEHNVPFVDDEVCLSCSA